MTELAFTEKKMCTLFVFGVIPATVTTTLSAENFKMSNLINTCRP